MPKPAWDLRSLIQRPEFIYDVLITLVFLIVTSLLVIQARDVVRAYEDQIMTQTRVKRVDFSIEDVAATEDRRREARQSAPRVYIPNATYLERLRAALHGLPKAVEAKTDLAQIADVVRAEFKLTTDTLRSLQAFVADGEATAEWKRAVDRLVDRELLMRPLLDPKEYQAYALTLQRVLRRGSDLTELPEGALQIASAPNSDFANALREMVTAAGFPTSVDDVIVGRLTSGAESTILFDSEGTQVQADQAAASVQPVIDAHRRGEVIFSVGDKLIPQQIEVLQRESEEYLAQTPRWHVWMSRLGVMGIILIVATLVGGYTGVFYPQIIRNPLRVVAIGALLTGMLAVSVFMAEQAPRLLFFATVGPTLLVAIITLLAYDQRIALFLSTMQCVLVTLALEQTVGMFILLFAGCSVLIAQLADVRHRGKLIRAATVTSILLAGGAVLVGVMETPLVPGAWRQIAVNAAWAAAAALGVGFLILGILPSIEQLFEITTGMTLAELRDPKHPLLRQLQEEAPGTYNHSLLVANIAETAADAVGANGLLAYVGALYHDIGKMNKPEYFVENQSGGYNRHAKLNPAMSLLIIVGHVKDGIELGREYGLPRQIIHFIEAHHGTTLVEYFYHAARSRARPDENIGESEFRYPGPKPRTRECAILMIADAVESATRAMAEPNPGRIESIVRQISRKRLMDGQFDQCDLTFRQLRQVEESIIKSMCALYHGRINYPGGRETDQFETDTSQPSPQPKTASA
jgi:putative nucleotidyltransferase with HDIG domain